MAKQKEIDVKTYEELIQSLLALDIGEIRQLNFTYLEKSITIKRIK